MKKRTARRKNAVTHKKAPHPSESVIIQFGVAFVVVAGFALLMYAMKYFLP